MAFGEHEPVGTQMRDFTDRMLWRDAQRLLARHSSRDERDCCAYCGENWPCRPHRLARRAQLAAQRPWLDAWTTRQGINGFRSLAGRRARQAERGTPGTGRGRSDQKRSS